MTALPSSMTTGLHVGLTTTAELMATTVLRDALWEDATALWEDDPVLWEDDTAAAGVAGSDVGVGLKCRTSVEDIGPTTVVVFAKKVNST